ncbi:High affinity cAMP-specific 3',5'-cyclic phosphodiesterase 7A, partial [Blyttiomyces sp. JEL0837]
MKSFTVCMLALSAIVVIVSSSCYDAEFFYRNQFVASYSLQQNNDKLVGQLKKLQKAYGSKVADFDSPLEKSILILRSVMADPKMGTTTFTALEQVVTLLGSSNLLTPDLENQLTEFMDTEQEAWLFSEIAQRRKTTRRAPQFNRGRRTSITSDVHFKISETIREVPVPMKSIPDVRLDGKSASMSVSAGPTMFPTAPDAPPPPLPTSGVTRKSPSLLLNRKPDTGRSNTNSILVTGTSMMLGNDSTLPIPIKTVHSLTFNTNNSSSLSPILPSNASKSFNHMSTTANATPLPPTIGIAATPVPLLTSSIFSDSDVEFIPTTDKLEELQASPKVVELLGRVDDYHFPIFDFVQATDGKPLSTLSYYLFKRADLFSMFQLTEEKFWRFIISIEKGYRSDLPYHNASHAADVLHSIAYLASMDSFTKFTTSFDTLCIYIAAIVHGIVNNALLSISKTSNLRFKQLSDYDHPGVNNNFLINTYDAKSILYNDKSILENHHLASAFATLNKPECNFVQGLSKADFKLMRETVIEMVLAT